MSRQLASALAAALKRRRADGLYRQLPDIEGLVDFCSNDYLGLARSGRLSGRIASAPDGCGDIPVSGSTGSRLISGNRRQIEQVESRLAEFHAAEAGTIFNTGYAANTGLFECIAGQGDTLILDKLAHASMIDGARLSKAHFVRFAHNDLDKLEARLERARGSIVIGVESVYSMNGDIAPLADLVALAEQYDAALVVDEAHSVGISGRHGAGLAAELGLEERIFGRVYTFGKALGLHGAVVVGSQLLKDHLINFARPFIYSTAPSPHSIECIRAAYALLPELDMERDTLTERIGYFRQHISHSRWRWLDSITPIQSVIIPGNESVRAIASSLREAGIGVLPIVAPTVPKGTERIRITVHAFNTNEEIDRLFTALEGSQAPCADMSLQV